MSNVSLSSAGSSRLCRPRARPAGVLTETQPWKHLRAPGKLNQWGYFKQQCRQCLWLRAGLLLLVAKVVVVIRGGSINCWIISVYT